MEGKDLFFKTKAKKFDIDKMALYHSVKNSWKSKRNATAEDDKYQQRINIILNAIKFKEGIEILDVGCDFGFQIIELAHLGARCTGLNLNEVGVGIINQVQDDFNLNLE